MGNDAALGKMTNDMFCICAGGLPVRGAGGALEASQLLDKAFPLSHTQIELIKKSSDYQLQVTSSSNHVPSNT